MRDRGVIGGVIIGRGVVVVVRIWVVALLITMVGVVGVGVTVLPWSTPLVIIILPTGGGVTVPLIVVVVVVVVIALLVLVD